MLPTIPTTTMTDVERVRAAISTLPPAERDLLVERFGPERENGEPVGCRVPTPAAVLRRLHHAAWVVQDLAGATRAQWGEVEPPLLRDRAGDLVEEEATAGVTPLLAARLAAALATEPPAADQHWRLHAVLRGVRGHLEGVLTALVVLGVAVPAVASLASL